MLWDSKDSFPPAEHTVIEDFFLPQTMFPAVGITCMPLWGVCWCFERVYIGFVDKNSMLVDIYWYKIDQNCPRSVSVCLPLMKEIGSCLSVPKDTCIVWCAKTFQHLRNSQWCSRHCNPHECLFSCIHWHFFLLTSSKNNHQKQEALVTIQWHFLCTRVEIQHNCNAFRYLAQYLHV